MSEYRFAVLVLAAALVSSPAVFAEKGDHPDHARDRVAERAERAERADHGGGGPKGDGDHTNDRKPALQDEKGGGGGGVPFSKIAPGPLAINKAEPPDAAPKPTPPKINLDKPHEPHEPHDRN